MILKGKLRVGGVLLWICVLTGCAQPPELASGGNESLGSFAVYVAAPASENGFLNKHIGPDGNAVYLESTPLVTADHLFQVSRTSANGGGPAILIELTRQGGDAVRSASDRYLGRQLAFVVDGEIASAPFVHGVLSTKLMIAGGSGGLTSEQVDSLIAELNAATSESG